MTAWDDRIDAFWSTADDARLDGAAIGREGEGNGKNEQNAG